MHVSLTNIRHLTIVRIPKKIVQDIVTPTRAHFDRLTSASLHVRPVALYSFALVLTSASRKIKGVLSVIFFSVCVEMKFRYLTQHLRG